MFRSAMKPAWIAAVLVIAILAAGAQAAVTAAGTSPAVEQLETDTGGEVEPAPRPGLPPDEATEPAAEPADTDWEPTAPPQQADPAQLADELHDVRARVSEVARGLLTPTDVQLILKGEWRALADSAKSKLYDLLVAAGATPVEAASILNRDWDSLQYFAKERLAQVLGEQLGISPELSEAALDGNWEEARNLAQVEAVEVLLGRFLTTSEATG